MPRRDSPDEKQTSLADNLQITNYAYGKRWSKEEEDVLLKAIGELGSLGDRKLSKADGDYMYFWWKVSGTVGATTGKNRTPKACRSKWVHMRQEEERKEREAAAKAAAEAAAMAAAAKPVEETVATTTEEPIPEEPVKDKYEVLLDNVAELLKKGRSEGLKPSMDQLRQLLVGGAKLEIQNFNLHISG